MGFKGAVFHDAARFRRSEFSGEANFEGVTFGADLYFNEVDCGSDVHFDTATFKSDAIFSDTTFTSAATFDRSSFEDTARFATRQLIMPDYRMFGGEISFRAVEFYDGVDFRDLVLDRADFSDADVTGGTFTGTNLREADFEAALLSRATLFGADLRGAKLSGAVLGDVRVDDETLFLGHPTADRDASPHTVAAIRSSPTCVYDPDYEADTDHTDIGKAKSMYRALEEIGNRAARARLQARCFVRRQDLQTHEYRTAASGPEHSLEQRVIAGARWSRAKIARATILYGESPWRVFGATAVVVLLCALLYPIAGIRTGGTVVSYGTTETVIGTLFDSLYFSVVTFTTLGYGDVQPIAFSRVVATVETIAGSALLALLVFVFGRRATR